MDKQNTKQEGQSNFCPNCETLARELKAIKQEQINSTTSMSLTSQDGAEQEQGEPVVGTKTWFEDGKVFTQNLYFSDVYTTPQPAQKPLTDEQIRKASLEAGMQEHYMDFHSGFIRFARAIEAAHGIKENT